MASPRSRRTPISIFEDEHANDEERPGDRSSGKEDTPSHGDPDESHHEAFDSDSDSGSDYDHEADISDSALSPTLHNVADPFTSSTLLSRPSLSPSADEPLKSIEPTHAPHSSDGSFSTTSRIHFDNHSDPHLDYYPPTPDENHLHPFPSDAVVKQGAYPHDENRKISESCSTIPDELEYYKSSIPGRSPLSQQRASAHNTPSRTLPYGPDHSRSNSAMRHDSRPYFRSPSSVRAMQMSSPPPFAVSPLSVKQKRGSPKHVRQSNSPFVAHSRDGTPTRRNRPKTELVPEAKQEFPLVLLHCTLHLVNTPAGYPAEALEDAGASDRVKRDSVLLKQKMDSTVLERGVLIQHPGEEYEVLEDRVLETLELKRPRVGACGHFRQNDEHDRREGEEVKATCLDCSCHLAHHLLSEEQQQRHRRWEVRVYAANGLMRSGAWSAAWREMEKVDVEIGVWLGAEDAGLGERLEEWARAKEREEEQEAVRMMEEETRRAEMMGEAPKPLQAMLRETTTFNMPYKEREARSPPSTAHVERPSTANSGSSRHHMPFEGTHVEQPEPSSTRQAQSPERLTSTPIPPSTDTASDFSQAQAELPLTALLLNYITRQYTKHQTLLLPALIVLLALYLGSASIFASKTTESISNVPINAPTATVTEMASPVIETITQTQIVEITATPSLDPVAAECGCDFEQMLKARGLVAIPKDKLEPQNGLDEDASKIEKTTSEAIGDKDTESQQQDVASREEDEEMSNADSAKGDLEASMEALSD